MSLMEKPPPKYRSNPVVVSEAAEALSHSDTTMKLTPSYELFQILSEEDGGTAPAIHRKIFTQRLPSKYGYQLERDTAVLRRKTNFNGTPRFTTGATVDLS